METGPRVWMAVKYGTLLELKTLLRGINSEEASEKGGPTSTSPLEEAVMKHDVDMVEALQYAIVDLDYENRENYVFRLAKSMSTTYNSAARRVFNTMYRRNLYHAAYTAQEAIVRARNMGNRLRTEIRLAVRMATHPRLGEQSSIGNLDKYLIDEIMKIYNEKTNLEIIASNAAVED
jgi:hypothetical protein